MQSIDLSKILLLSREKCSLAFLKIGLLTASLGSLHPWFMWPLNELYIIPACFCVYCSILLSKPVGHKLYTKSDYTVSLLLYAVFSFYLLVSAGANINGLIVNSFSILIFYALFRLDPGRYDAVGTFLAKSYAVILAFSIAAFVLHLMGFPLPSKSVTFGEEALYSYNNYYFFLLDDRFMSAIFPRFSSVFLEPGHMGTATVLLLMSQRGKWKKWYNVVLLTASVLSFSLAAYVFLVVIVLLNSWIEKRHLWAKLAAFAVLIGGLTAFAYLYHGGDNVFHDMILLRLEIEDGEMAGNNRVTDDFKTDFANYITSGDIVFGREMDARFAGNSGYRVFLYDHGLVGLLLLVLFYASWMIHAEYRRAVFSAIVIAFLLFMVRGYMLWYSFFIPIFITALRAGPEEKTVVESR